MTFLPALLPAFSFIIAAVVHRIPSRAPPERSHHLPRSSSAGLRGSADTREHDPFIDLIELFITCQLLHPVTSPPGSPQDISCSGSPTAFGAVTSSGDSGPDNAWLPRTTVSDDAPTETDLRVAGLLTDRVLRLGAAGKKPVIRLRQRGRRLF
ncbi:hypothetical protein [Corynebacterium sp.]|uniref:hypothetical protein n=1 Tax=Corynebacterium sp. TaxID=1720 RepID=UPI0028A638B5|nr:hypothetical protein [Corynebacterium sp.]